MMLFDALESRGWGLGLELSDFDKTLCANSRAKSARRCSSRTCFELQSNVLRYRECVGGGAVRRDATGAKAAAFFFSLDGAQTFRFLSTPAAIPTPVSSRIFGCCYFSLVFTGTTGGLLLCLQASVVVVF